MLVGPSILSSLSLNGKQTCFPYTSEVDAIITFFLYRLASSNTISVPFRLVNIEVIGWSIIYFTPTAAAIWYTISHWLIRRFISVRLKIVFLWKIKDLFFRRYLMLDFLDVAKLSIAQTLKPLDKSSSQRCEPIKPVPPVTKTLLTIFFINTPNYLSY